MGGFSAPPIVGARQLNLPPPADPLEQYARIVQIRNAMQQGQLQQQLGQQELQQRQYQFGQTQAINRSYQQALKVDANGTPSIDTDVLQRSLAEAGHGSAIPSILEGLTKYQKSNADLQEQLSKVQQAARDSLGSLGYTMQKANYDPAIADLLIQQRLGTPGLPPQQKQQLTMLRTQLQQNPGLIKQYADQFVAGSDEQRKIGAQELQAQARMKSAGAAGGQLPLSDKVPQLNQLLEQRWQVLNPGQPLPKSYTLASDATQRDFDNIDKVLESTERGQATAAQQATANAIRQQTFQITQQNQLDREEKQGTKWVSWEDPKSGRTVAGPLSMAKEQGIKHPAEVPTEEIRNITDARGAVNLVRKTGDPNNPETMGVLQLVNSLDKDGRLGIASSRLNSFLAGGVGTSPGDDPRIITLLDKTQLLMTLSMKAHFGASGGRSPQMLEHFLGMANAKKMDATTLRAGVKAIGNYMEDRAMLPESGAPQRSQPGGFTAPGPADVTRTGTLNGRKVYQLKSGATVYADGSPAQ